MFKKLKLPALLLGAALALLSPSMARAEHHGRERHHRFGVYLGYEHGPRHYAYGYYDRWGYWHPYRYYRY